MEIITLQLPWRRPYRVKVLKSVHNPILFITIDNDYIWFKLNTGAADVKTLYTFDPYTIDPLSLSLYHSTSPPFLPNTILYKYTIPRDDYDSKHEIHFRYNVQPGFVLMLLSSWWNLLTCFIFLFLAVLLRLLLLMYHILNAKLSATSTPIKTWQCFNLIFLTLLYFPYNCVCVMFCICSMVVEWIIILCIWMVINVLFHNYFHHHHHHQDLINNSIQTKSIQSTFRI